MPSVCVSPDVIKSISEKYEGKASCIVKPPDCVLCDFQRTMAIHIPFVCDIQNKEHERDKGEDNKDYEGNDEKDYRITMMTTKMATKMTTKMTQELTKKKTEKMRKCMTKKT